MLKAFLYSVAVGSLWFRRFFRLTTQSTGLLQQLLDVSNERRIQLNRNFL
jgi:hypothetical protein